MKIKCGNCSIDHELEPPAWVLSSGRAFRFRCSSCGVSQMVQPQTPGNTSISSSATLVPSDLPTEPSEAPQDTPLSALPTAEVPRPPSEQSGGTVYLKQDGKVYLIKDWSTVQRWIMERRVERSDLVSEGGVRWEPIGSRPELGSFFAAVDRMEAVDRGDPVAAPAPAAPAPAAPPSPFAGMGEKPSTGGGLFGGGGD